MFISIQENHVFNPLSVVIKIMSKQFYAVQTRTKEKYFNNFVKSLIFNLLPLSCSLVKPTSIYGTPKNKQCREHIFSKFNFLASTEDFNYICEVGTDELFLLLLNKHAQKYIRTH